MVNICHNYTVIHLDVNVLRNKYYVEVPILTHFFFLFFCLV